MFFNKQIKKNLKLLVVLSLAFLPLFAMYDAVYAADSEIVSPGSAPGVISIPGYEVRTEGFFTYKKQDDILGVIDTETDYLITTRQADEGLTSQLNNSGNLAYSVQRSNLKSPNGTYAIGTGKLPNGWSATTIYDKGALGTEANPDNDVLREIRLESSDGRKYSYIYTADFQGGKVTAYNKNGVDDKKIINAIGTAIGNPNLYDKLTAADEKSHLQSAIETVQEGVEKGAITAEKGQYIIDKIKSGTPLTDAEAESLKADLYKLHTSTLAGGGRIILNSNNVLTTVDENDAVAASASQADAAIKDAELNKKGVFARDEHNGQCFGIQERTAPYFFVDIFNCISQIFYYLLSLSTLALSLVGGAFNQVFKITVVNMKGFVDSVGIINVGWVAIRDMSNILFIFMLLYLAIATILQLDEHGVKHGLSRLIVGAVLINFSLFFVKIPIDISNILAIEIYDKINPKTAVEFGMGDAILSSLNFQNIYGARDGNTLFDTDTEKGMQAFAQSHSPTITFVMAMIMIAALIFVFVAVIIIFIKRLVTLMMLMIFSPLAFAGIAIPNHSISHEIDSKFWGTLLRESFFAPVFMFIMYLGLMILNSDGFKVSIFSGGISDGSFQDGIVTVGTIINYVVVIFIFIFALTVSEVMGVKGAEGAIKAFDGMRGYASGWVGRNTIGRIANSTLQKGESAVWLRKAAAGQVGGNMLTRFAAQQFARGAIKTTSSLAANKFGSDESYDDKVHNREEEFKAMLDELHDDPKAIAQLLTGGANDKLKKWGTDRKAADRLFHHLSGEQKASVKKYLADDTSAKGKDALKRYYTDHGHGRLTPDEALDLEKMEREKIDSYDKQMFRLEALGGHVDGNHVDANMDKAIARFQNFSDKKKSDMLNTLGKDELGTMLRDSKFKDLIRENMNTFQKAAKVYDNASDELKAVLDDVYSDAKARVHLAAALTSGTKKGPDGKPLAMNDAEIKTAKVRLINLMEKLQEFKGQTNGKSVDELLKMYNDSKLAPKDAVFVRAKGNASRIFEMNKNTKMVYADLGLADEN